MDADLVYLSRFDFYTPGMDADLVYLENFLNSSVILKNYTCPFT